MCRTVICAARFMNVVLVTCGLAAVGCGSDVGHPPTGTASSRAVRPTSTTSSASADQAASQALGDYPPPALARQGIVYSGARCVQVPAPVFSAHGSALYSCQLLNGTEAGSPMGSAGVVGIESAAGQYVFALDPDGSVLQTCEQASLVSNCEQGLMAEDAAGGVSHPTSATGAARSNAPSGASSTTSSSPSSPGGTSTTVGSGGSAPPLTPCSYTYTIPHVTVDVQGDSCYLALGLFSDYGSQDITGACPGWCGYFGVSDQSGNLHYFNCSQTGATISCTDTSNSALVQWTTAALASAEKQASSG